MEQAKALFLAVAYGGSIKNNLPEGFTLLPPLIFSYKTEIKNTTARMVERKHRLHEVLPGGREVGGEQFIFALPQNARTAALGQSRGYRAQSREVS